MKPMLSLLAIAAGMAAQCACAQNERSAQYSQAELFKNWALSRCLAKAYSSEEAKKDASISASGYLEFGNAPIEAYEAGDALVDQYLARKYRGTVPGSFNTMKCIDLYHSKELAALALKSTSANSK